MSEELFRIIFSKNLRKYMELNGKNQMDLMRDLKLSSSTVSNWCTGLKLPRMDKVQMLADYFGILKSDLLEDKQEETDEYYFNTETRQMAQEIFQNEELRLLFSEARDAEPEDLKATHDILLALKRKERGNN